MSNSVSAAKKLHINKISQPTIPVFLLTKRLCFRKVSYLINKVETGKYVKTPFLEPLTL